VAGTFPEGDPEATVHLWKNGYEMDPGALERTQPPKPIFGQSVGYEPDPFADRRPPSPARVGFRHGFGESSARYDEEYAREEEQKPHPELAPLYREDAAFRREQAAQNPLGAYPYYPGQGAKWHVGNTAGKVAPWAAHKARAGITGATLGRLAALASTRF